MHQVTELLGAIIIVLGCGTTVAAAAMISVPLATLAAGVFLVVGGIVTVYVASALEAKAKVATKPGDRP